MYVCFCTSIAPMTIYWGLPYDVNGKILKVVQFYTVIRLYNLCAVCISGQWLGE